MVRAELERVELLIHERGIDGLQAATVMVVGLGGVGAMAAEALTRSGVGHLVLVDHDIISASNINRQIHSLQSTLGIKKSAALRARLLDINPQLVLDIHDCFVDQAHVEMLFDRPIDAVIDAIDTITCKAILLHEAHKRGILKISSMGMGNRMDPTQLDLRPLSKTTYDPVARTLRHLAKEFQLDDFMVVFSREAPIKPHHQVNPAGETRKVKMPPGSSPFVPNAAGLAAASYIVTKLLERLYNDSEV